MTQLPYTVTADNIRRVEYALALMASSENYSLQSSTELQQFDTAMTILNTTIDTIATFYNANSGDPVPFHQIEIDK